MAVPQERRYLKTHEWFKPQGDLIVVGITEHAVHELTDITFVQLPAIGRKVKAGESFGEVESVKATSELYSGMDGEVVEVNEQLAGDPGLLNRDPFESAWIMKIRPTNKSQYDSLLTPADYEAGL